MKLKPFFILAFATIVTTNVFAESKILTNFYHMNTELGPVFYAKVGPTKVKLENESGLYSPEPGDSITLNNFSVIEGEMALSLASSKQKKSFTCSQCLYVKYGPKGQWLPIAIQNKKTLKIEDGRVESTLTGYDVIAPDFVNVYQLKNDPEYGIIELK